MLRRLSTIPAFTRGLILITTGSLTLGVTTAVCDVGSQEGVLVMSPDPKTNPVPLIRPSTQPDAFVPGHASEPNGLLSVSFMHTLLARHQSITTLHKGMVSEYHTNTFPANPSIEDTYSVLSGLPTSPSSMLFGVFDGHSGGMCSDFAKRHFFKFVNAFAKKEKKEGTELLTAQSFLNADKYFLDYADKVKDRSGACANVAHVNGNDLVVANAGDCRAVIGRSFTDKGTGMTRWEAIPLSVDHELKYNQAERQRLLTEHPDEDDVIKRNRIKGHLQPTRGLGDGTYKRMSFFERNKRYKQMHGDNWYPPYATADPEFQHHTLLPSSTDKSGLIVKDEFLVMATDGLYEDLSNTQVVATLGRYMQQRSEAKGDVPVLNAASWLVHEALSTASVERYGAPVNQTLASVRQRPPLGATADTAHAPSSLLSQMYLSRLLMDRRSRRNIHDDITCIVVFFDEPNDVKSKL